MQSIMAETEGFRDGSGVSSLHVIRMQYYQFAFTQMDYKGCVNVLYSLRGRVRCQPVAHQSTWADEV